MKKIMKTIDLPDVQDPSDVILAGEENDPGPQGNRDETEILSDQDRTKKLVVKPFPCVNLMSIAPRKHL
jgi:hypothetical protein